jgi:5-hydroxyisourate hydrolase-like protein (transthyretin family)
MVMDYFKGDKALLYCEFRVENKIIKVDNPKVRVLHEADEVVYEDLPWKSMNALDEGYSYTFDTNICDNYGQYVVVYRGMFNGETLNVLDKFNIVVKNIEDINSIYLYGYVNDINNNRLLKGLTVKVVELESNNVVFSTLTDEDGKWESKLYPGDYEFVFSMNGYESRSVRAQIGDENEEIQFNNIGLEKISDKALGNGLFKIEDEFTSKNDMGIPDVEISIFNIDDIETALIETKTDNHGKWKVFLDEGNYVMKIKTPTGILKKFKLNVYNSGEKTIEEIVSKDTKTKTKTVYNGNGENEVVDYILDAHGNGIEGASIIASVYNIEKDIYEYVCEDITDVDGSFKLNLNKGKYKFVINSNGFKTSEQIIDI